MQRSSSGQDTSFSARKTGVRISAAAPKFAPVAQRMSTPLRTERHAGSTPVGSSNMNRVKLVQKSPALGTRRTVGGTPHPDQINQRRAP
jgi:hypothetical protein